MEIRIVTVGKIKEKYLCDGIAEYAKRLSRYCRLTFCQVADEKTPDKASEALNTQIKNTEGERLMKHIREQDYVIALAIDGKTPDSVELSQKIEKLGVSGISSIAFVIGGSLGLSESVLKRADYKLSFSRMTFPHQLMQMLYAPFRGCVRKPRMAILLQRHALHLHQMKPSLRLDAKVQPGPAVSILRTDGGDVRQETSGRRPLRKCLIGSLRVHIDKNATLFHRNQIVCGFSVGIGSLFQIDRTPRH